MEWIRLDENNGGDVNLLTLIQTGVWVEFEVDETVSEFIHRILSIDKKKMHAEVQTLLLNSRVVDDPDTTCLQYGDILVLSGAMPGLVGAMLRSGSPIKAMRKEISGAEPNESPSEPPSFSNKIPEGPLSEEDPNISFLRLKLFNTILINYKNRILKTGFYIPAAEYES
ncbi:MAG: hypothetical protein JEY99_21005 [Spirochaetales bacterium]|nr:hypothetical protein [Spirochaetales bacterium]